MPETATGQDASPREDARLMAVMAAEIRARRMRDLASERLARARAEQVEIEEALRRADVTIRQGRARLAAIADANTAAADMHEAGASDEQARALASRRELIADLGRQLAECESEARGQAAALEARRLDSERMRRHLDTAHAEEAELRRGIEATRHTAIELSGELGDLNTQCADLHARLKREIESVAALEAELDTLLRRRDLVEATRQATAERIAAAEILHAEDEQRHSAAVAQSRALRDELARLEAERTELEAAIAAENRATLQANAMLAESRQSRALAEQDLAATLQARDDTTARQAALADELERTRASQRDEQAARDDIERQLDATRQQAATLADALNRETADLARTQQRLRKVRSARERRSAELESALSTDSPDHEAFPARSHAAMDPSLDPIAAPSAVPPSPVPADSPGPARKVGAAWRPRAALACAFGAAALAIYLVPRLWPGGKPPTGTPEAAAEKPLATVTAPPGDIYPADPGAQRDLSLAREMRLPPERP